MDKSTEVQTGAALEGVGAQGVDAPSAADTFADPIGDPSIQRSAAPSSWIITADTSYADQVTLGLIMILILTLPVSLTKLDPNHSNHTFILFYHYYYFK